MGQGFGAQNPELSLVGEVVLDPEEYCQTQLARAMQFTAPSCLQGASTHWKLSLNAQVSGGQVKARYSEHFFGAQVLVREPAVVDA